MLLIVVGTRPQHIKLASLARALNRQGIEYVVVHTGQHYDYELDEIFFEELDLPRPVAHLGVGSGSHGYQTGTMLMRLEKVYKKFKPKMIIVPGDTNSALAGALAGVKMGFPIAHVEAGLRSRLPYMAEEVNRVLIDHVSEMLFAPTEYAYVNLLKEGIDFSRIFLTGDVMADNIILFEKRIDEIFNEFHGEKYVYVTVHRAENTDNYFRLRNIVKALVKLSKEQDFTVVFPLHPRTQNKLSEYGLLNTLRNAENIKLMKPVGYVKSLRYARDARIVLTDSGGLQKEAFILRTPIVTLRETTEWIETVECGWNIPVGPDSSRIVEAVSTLLEKELPEVDPLKFYGSGRASERIANLVREYLS